jgi:hypothetical protein
MYEDERFTLVGVDGNAFSVMGYVLRCMRTCKLPKAEQDKYLEDAKSSDYNHLLAVSCEMIDRLNKEFDSSHDLNPLCEYGKEMDF